MKRSKADFMVAAIGLSRGPISLSSRILHSDNNPDRNCGPIVAPKPYQWHRCDEFIHLWKTYFYLTCLATFTLILDLDCSVFVLPRVRKLEKRLYLLIELITKYEYHRWKDGVCEVHKSMTRDAVESKINNWLRHCPRYAFKNNEDEKINGEEELRQDDSDY
ncbi:hypothetical protein OUZ56_010466 [Daphnia magna]|uniref:Uncharacterized protein n=1 Tax=Daphnia magna TaxID=35525 RepID=A0ABR0AIM0_9CRUS|nr:hypothetical protein OUZ56_010466 [Daphnia magna]